MDIFWLLYLCIIIIGIIVGTLTYKKLNSSSKRMLLLLYFVLFVELIALSLKYFKYTNLTIYHFSTPTFLILYIWSYNKELTFKIKNIHLAIVVYFLAALNAFFFEIYNKVFPSSMYIFSSIITIFISLLYFSKLLKVQNIINIQEYPLFWLSCGLLFFHTINIFGYGAFQFINLQKNIFFHDFFIYLRRISNYILYSLFIVAFLQKQKSLK